MRVSEVLTYTKKAWEFHLGIRKNKVQWILTLTALAIFIYCLPKFMQYIEQRETSALYDPLLSLLPTYSLSGATFTVLYLSILLGLAHLIQHPLLLLRGLNAYILMLVFRMICIYLTPLSPPEGMIVLVDPMIDFLIGSSGSPITKDLFFSGHTSTIFLLMLACNGRVKHLLVITTLAVVTMILLQKVHYTIDVLVAPIFTWFAWYIACKYVKRQDAFHKSYQSA